jgi:hypothetical protein
MLRFLTWLYYQLSYYLIDLELGAVSGASLARVVRGNPQLVHLELQCMNMHASIESDFKTAFFWMLLPYSAR